MAGGFALAEAFVRIRPNTDGFRAEADAGIKSALAGENPEVTVRAATDAAKAAVGDLRAYIDAMTRKVGQFRLIADDKLLQAQLAKDALLLDKLDKMVASPEIDLAGITRAQAEILGLDAGLDKIAGRLVTAHVAVDEGNAPARLAVLEAELTALTSKAKEIKLGISDPAGLVLLDELQRKINELHGRVVNIGFLDAAGSAGDAMRQILQLKRIMQTAGLADFLDYNLKPSQILSQLVILKQRIAASGLSDTLAVNVDSNQVLRQIADLENTLNAIPDINIGVSAMSLGGTEAEVSRLSAAMTELAGSEAEAAVSGGRFSAGWGGIIRGLATAIPLFDGALPGILASVAAWHLLVDVGFEFLAVLIPAAAGMLAFGAAAVPTAQDIYTQMKNILTVTTATGKAMYPLSGSFQQVAKAVQPQVYQLFGDALTVISGKTREFRALAVGTGQALDQLFGRATAALLSGGFSQFLRNAEKDVMGLGTVIGNVFGTLGNLLKTMPGYAQYIMDAFVTVTHAVEVFTGTGAVQGLLKAGLAMHGAWVYAGLGVTAFSIVARGGLTMMGNLAEKAAMAALSSDALGAAGQRAGVALLGMSAGASDLAALPWGWISIAAAAFGVFAYAVTRTSDETATWIGQLNAWIGAAPAGIQGATRLASAQTNIAIALQGVNVNANRAAGPVGYITGAFKSLGQILSTLVPGLNNITGSLGRSSTHLTQMQQQMNTVHWSAFALGVDASGTALAGLATGLQMAAQWFGLAKTPAQELSAEQQKLADQSALYHDRLGKLAVAVGGVSTAQTLLTASGITMNQMLDGSKTTWNIILQQVAATIAAYRAMGQRAGILGADLNAMNLAASDQVTQMTKLNQAFDSVIGIVSGGQTAFLQFETLLNTTDKAARAAGASMGGLNKPSLALRTDWQQAYTSGSQLLDALRMMTSINPGAQNGSFPMLTQAMKDTLAQMLPLGKQSAATRAEMVSLAQEINPNINDFQQLTKWVGNVQNPAKGLNKILSDLGVSIQSLSKDASTLYATLQTDLLKQFDEAKIKASGAAKALSTLATDVTTAGTSAQKIHGDEVTLAADLVKSGLSAQDAGTLILSMGGHIKVAGDTASQKHQDLVNLYNDFVQAGVGAQNAARLVRILTGDLFNVPKNTTANVDANFTASGGAAIRAEVQGKTWVSHLVPAHAAEGMLVPGTGSSDTVPAMLTPGEAVVPKRLVRYIAPWLGRHRVPGFAGGGLVGSEVNNVAPWAGHQESVWGGQTAQDFSSQVVHSFWVAERAAVAAARAAAAIGGRAGPGGGAPLANAMLAYRLYHNQMTQAMWTAWGNVAMAESGWNQYATNPSSGAYGIAQALPYTKYPKAGWPAFAGGSSNPMAQITWMWSYMMSQYGGPLGAWAHEQAHHWYGKGGKVMDHGGWLTPGMNHVWNGTGRLEKVTPPNATSTLEVCWKGRPSHPLEGALWDWIVKNVDIRGGGDVQVAMGRRS